VKHLLLKLGHWFYTISSECLSSVSYIAFDEFLRRVKPFSPLFAVDFLLINCHQKWMDKDYLALLPKHRHIAFNYIYIYDIYIYVCVYKNVYYTK
jgi:hypothetical protein